ncbi:hypothetical protein D3C85_1300800 [compost metagenome]
MLQLLFIVDRPAATVSDDTHGSSAEASDRLPVRTESIQAARAQVIELSEVKFLCKLALLRRDFVVLDAEVLGGLCLPEVLDREALVDHLLHYLVQFHPQHYSRAAVIRHIELRPVIGVGAGIGVTVALCPFRLPIQNVTPVVLLAWNLLEGDE